MSEDKPIQTIEFPLTKEDEEIIDSMATFLKMFGFTEDETQLEVLKFGFNLTYWYIVEQLSEFLKRVEDSKSGVTTSYDKISFVNKKEGYSE